MFSQAKLYILGATALAFVGLSVTVYVYKLKFDKAEIQRDVAQQQRDTMIEVNRQIMEGVKRDAELRQNLYTDLQEARNDAAEAKKVIASHDLSELAKARPGLITRLARRATVRVLSDIEAAANETPTNMSEPAGSGPDQPASSPADSDAH